MSHWGSWMLKGYIMDCQKPSLCIFWLTSENSKTDWCWGGKCIMFHSWKDGNFYRNLSLFSYRKRNTFLILQLYHTLSKYMCARFEFTERLSIEYDTQSITHVKAQTKPAHNKPACLLAEWTYRPWWVTFNLFFGWTVRWSSHRLQVQSPMGCGSQYLMTITCIGHKLSWTWTLVFNDWTWKNMVADH